MDSSEMTTRFTAGDRVRASDDFFWAKRATGRVASPPPEVRTLSGDWGGLTRIATRASGNNIIYWSIGFGLTSRNMMQMAVARTEEAKFGSARST
jgi:hypothetical protein